MSDMQTIATGIALLETVLSSINSVIDLIPKRQKDEASEKLHEIETNLKLAETQIAKGLGYELCKCTWPPQIMLHDGEAEYGERFRCPACSRLVSPDDMPPLNDWRTI